MAEVSTIARPYAKAAFEYAAERGQLQDWSVLLGQLSALTDNADIGAVLDSPTVTDSQKAGILMDACGSAMNEQVKSFLQVLAEHKRLSVIPAIADAYETLKASQQQSIDVEVTSAFELDEQQRTTLQSSLRNKWQQEVSLSTSVDNSLVGGVIIRAGDMVIDGSIRGRLEKLALEVNV